MLRLDMRNLHPPNVRGIRFVSPFSLRFERARSLGGDRQHHGEHTRRLPNRYPLRLSEEDSLGFSTIFFIRSVNRPKSPSVFIASGFGGCFAGLSHVFFMDTVYSFA
jgi:hypothetical protein